MHDTITTVTCDNILKFAQDWHC